MQGHLATAAYRKPDPTRTEPYLVAPYGILFLDSPAVCKIKLGAKLHGTRLSWVGFDVLSTFVSDFTLGSEDLDNGKAYLTSWITWMNLCTLSVPRKRMCPLQASHLILVQPLWKLLALWWEMQKCSTSLSGGSSPSTHPCQAWPRHKEVCIALPTVTALYFPSHTTSNRPTVVSVKCRPRVVDQDSGSRPCPLPRVGRYFSNGSKLSEEKAEMGSLIITMGLGPESLRFPLQLWYDKRAMAEGGPVNMCIQLITMGKANRSWGGDVVVMKFDGSRQQNYTDASLTDLPPLVNYFLHLKWRWVVIMFYH